MCIRDSSNGVVISIDELKKGYEESYSRYRGWRANFPWFKCEEKASHVFWEDGASRVYLIDKRSANNSPVYYNVPG